MPASATQEPAQPPAAQPALRVSATPKLHMPEPLLGESLTDIDGVDAGELEVDLGAMALHRAQPGNALWRSAVEVEYRALPRLGLGLEVGLGGPFGAGPAAALSLRPALSFSLLHDLSRDLHVQLEASGRVLENDQAGQPELEPGDAALPFSAGVRAGWRLPFLTLRGFAGGGAFGPSAHAVPVIVQLAALRELGPGGRFGFFGFELDGDWARASPVVVAPNLVLDGAAVGIPAKLGFALPWTVGPRAGEPAVGVLVRLMVEVDND